MDCRIFYNPSMPTYTVKQGDTIIGLAAKNGFKDADTILNASDNSSLKQSRTDPGILFPGDVVVIPSRELLQHPSAVDASHKFKITRPKAWIRLVVKDAAGKALANLKYQLTVGSKQWNGMLPADGVLEQAVSPNARDGRLTVWLDDKNTEIWDLAIGSMDPLDEISGVQSRLNNLGFDCGEPNGKLNDATKDAIRAFQARLGIDITGAIDDTLKQKLTSYYDPTQDESTQESTSS